MGAGAVARAAAVLAALAPAAAWYVVPCSSLLAVVVAAVAVAAALHGLGRLVGAIAGDLDAPAALTIAWGLAAYLALAGLLAGAGAFDGGAQRVIMVAATAVGAAWCGRAAQRPRAWRLRPGLWMVAPAAATALVALHVLGAAGTTTGRFFDGEIFQLGPIARLRATGELGDAFGMPRSSGLGGGVLLGSLGAAFEHARQLHVVDALGFALVLALAFAGTRRHAARVIALFAIAVLASATPVYPFDVAPRWTVVALLFALHASLGRLASDGRRPWAALLLAGALAGIWHAGLGVAAVIAVHVIRAAPPGRARRTVALGAALVLALAVGGLVLSALIAYGREPASGGWLATLAPGAAARVAVWSAVALAVYALAGLAVRDLGDRPLLTMAPAVAAAALAAGVLAPSPAMAWTAWQPFALGLVLLLIAPALLRDPIGAGPHPATSLAIVGTVLAIAVLRFPVGVPRTSWEDRLVRQLDGADALGERWSRRDAHFAADLAAAQRAIPAGARVGIWLERPDLIDYRRRDIIDLRSAASAACIDQLPRTPRMPVRRLAPCARLDALLPRLDLDFLLISPTVLPRPDAWFKQPRCFLFAPLDCIDPITRFVGRDRMLTPAPLLVVDLR